MNGPGHLLATLALLAVLGGAAEGSPRAPRPAPDFSGGTKWFNVGGAEALSIAAFRNRVVLVEFWTGGCINCLNTLPWIRRWHAQFGPAGLVVVGVHSPEFAHEHREAYVRERLRTLQIVYPVVMDNDFRIWRAYRNQYWPTLYLVDRSGRIRSTHIGEGGYAATERMIRLLLAEPVR